MKRTGMPFIKDQDGSVMVMALLIMATLAVVGMMATNDAVMDSKVGRNYAIQQQNVFAAEAAAKEMAQAIDNKFDEADNGSEAVGNLEAEDWSPHDGYNNDFDFDKTKWGTYNTKSSDLEASVDFAEEAKAIAVLADRNTSSMTPGLGGAKVPEEYDYIIFGKAVHAGAGSSEAIVMLGYRQKKAKG